jgi:hypothetical protein
MAIKDAPSKMKRVPELPDNLRETVPSPGIECPDYSSGYFFRDVLTSYRKPETGKYHFSIKQRKNLTIIKNFFCLFHY